METLVRVNLARGSLAGAVRCPMERFALGAAIALLLVVSVVSARVLIRVLVPGRREVLRLQNERIERTLRDDSDSQLELGELPN